MKKQKFNFEYLVDVVNGFSPCMNDYLYVYDLKNDTYFITESALERFRLPGNLFHKVVESHALFTYPDDVPMLQDDLGKLLRGEQKMHDLRSYLDQLQGKDSGRRRGRTGVSGWLYQ